MSAKIFGKIFDQIFESSIAERYQTRHIFMDLIVLGWPKGIIDKTYEAISRRINVPIEIVINAISELEQADPQSRTKTAKGARLVRLTDSDGNPRAWGWKIVNYETYLKIRSQEKEAKSSAERVRKHRNRKKGLKQECNGGNGSVTPVTNVTPCNRCGAPVAGENVTTCNDCNTPGNANQSQNENTCCLFKDAPLSLAEARSLLISFCRKHFIRIPSEAQWHNCFDSHIEEAMPISRRDIEVLDWYYGLEDELLGELKVILRREFANVITYLPGEIQKAYAVDKRLRASAEPRKKNDPPKWREFLRARYGPDIRLPENFEELDEDLRNEYDAGIANFKEEPPA